MKIALASPPFPSSLNDALYWLEKLAKEAASAGAALVCFPESFLPGYPGMHTAEADRSPKSLRAALQRACQVAKENSIALIVPMDWPSENGLLNVAQVIDKGGEVLGYQTKNQLDPSEDNIWMPGNERQLFEVDGFRFGITICHEGFRYPESVRWAAREGAAIVFHPHFTGSNTDGPVLTEWGAKTNPYYEKAAMMRALENTIYFASVNYASRFPESATSLIAPDGNCIVHETYGRVGIITADVDVAQATGVLAKRFKPELYR